MRSTLRIAPELLEKLLHLPPGVQITSASSRVENGRVVVLAGIDGDGVPDGKECFIAHKTQEPVRFVGFVEVPPWQD